MPTSPAEVEAGATVGGESEEEGDEAPVEATTVPGVQSRAWKRPQFQGPGFRVPCSGFPVSSFEFNDLGFRV